MIIDNNGKLFGKINIIDVFVIVILLLAITVTYFKFNMSAHSDVSETNSYVEYEIKAKAVRDFSIDAVKKGDKVYDTENDVYLGDVLSVRSEVATEYLTKTDGTIVKCELPDKYDFYITLGADARVNDTGIYVGGTKPIINHSNLQIATQRSKMTTEVVSVKVK